jgi:fructosamine-3-kinase
MNDYSSTLLEGKMSLPTTDFPNKRLLSDRFRRPVERVVSTHFGYPWHVAWFSDMNEYASHPSAILLDAAPEAGGHGVFIKLSEAAHGQDQFESELAGLRTLSELAGVLIPPPVGIVPAEGGVMLILEAVEQIERTPEAWREIGRTLARIHLVKGDRCGFDQYCYFGPLYQDNRPADGWLPFYIERRLWPRFMGAIDSGNLSTDIIRKVERFIDRVPGLDIPEVEPVLLHGDAQQNNYISTRQGAVVIDPAVHYGNPEMDLAYLDYFQPVPGDVFLGYQEIRPIDPGFAERKDIWRVAAYLAAVQVGWLAPMGMLVAAVEKYI